MNLRAEQITSLAKGTDWDIVIVGGGATGLGAALDAASRGYKTLCIERFDFSKGTSSRSTKLIHGGVRYLEKGNIKLVKGALRERWFLLRNAPDMTRTIPFILPVYSWFKFIYYGFGLKMYDFLSGKLSLGKTRFLSLGKVKEAIPEIKTNGLIGGILYYDGQFDDSEISLSLVRTAISYGATVINYCEAVRFIYREDKISGLVVVDNIDQKEYTISAKVVINATGVFADHLIRMDNKKHKNIVTPSQGIHIVVEKLFYSGNHALLIPRTTDGRVLFVVPWHDKVVIGTTDTKKASPSIEPKASEEEIDFVINNFNQYTGIQIERKDILSVFAGLRPLVKMSAKQSTADLLRDHVVFASASGLVTITGGKWTTYRKMAKDVINKAALVAGLPYFRCKTSRIRLMHKRVNKDMDVNNPLIHPAYSYTKEDVIYAVRDEMAMTPEDVLARRIRLLFLDVKAALECADVVASIIQEELQKDNEWKEMELKSFRNLAKKYITN